MKPAPRRPKRILITADTIGGVWTYSLELARALRPYGIHVALATMGRLPSPEQRDEVSRLHNVELCESDYKLEWMPEPWQDVEAAGDWLLALEQRFKPDIIHLNSYAHAALPWHAPKLVVGHSCVMSWWQAVHGVEAPEEWNIYRRKVTTGLRSADLVVAPSAAMLAQLDLRYGPLKHSRLIYSGRRLRDLRLRPKEPLILSVGRLWDPAKNTAALADVAPELPWPVHIAGDTINPAGEMSPGLGGGDGHATLPSAERPQPMPAHYLGRLSPDGLTTWFERAALYALPARYEPFGLSILEAAQAGCALILGDLDSLRELWAEAAIFVSPSDLDELKEALKEVIDSPLWRAELAHRAKARAEHFTPEAMASGYFAAYSQLLARSQSVVGTPIFGQGDSKTPSLSSTLCKRRGTARLRTHCGRRRRKAQPHSVAQ